MHKDTKIVLAVLGALLVLGAGFYGSFLPLRKSQAIIYALRNLKDAASFSEVKDGLSVPIRFPSPIGQEEIVRNVANIIVSAVQQSDKPEAISDAVAFLEGQYKPIIDRGVGMSFEQNLYILGALNELAFVKTKQVRFLTAAHGYFEHGLRLGPKRPQFLYGMFDIYRIEGNIEGVNNISARILSEWPSDNRIKAGLDEFLQKVASSTATKGKN